jgi:hypothetical protein
MVGSVDTAAHFAKLAFQHYAPLCDQVLSNACLATTCVNLGLHATLQGDLRKAEYYFVSIAAYLRNYTRPHLMDTNAQMRETMRDRHLRTMYFHANHIFTLACNGPQIDLDISWLFKILIRAEYTRQVLKRLNNFTETNGHNEPLPPNIFNVDSALYMLDNAITKELEGGSNIPLNDIDTIDMIANRLSQDDVNAHSPMRQMMKLCVLAVKANSLRQMKRYKDAYMTVNIISEIGNNYIHDRAPLLMLEPIALTARVHLDMAENNIYTDELTSYIQKDLVLMEQIASKCPVYTMLYAPIMNGLRQVLQPQLVIPLSPSSQNSCDSCGSSGSELFENGDTFLNQLLQDDIDFFNIAEEGDPFVFM